jgi:cysteine synthase
MQTVAASSTELVYASPVQGGAQIALAFCARELGKTVSIFCAKRNQRHPRTEQVMQLGANVYEIAPGYLSVVQSRARDYCKKSGSILLPFGMNTPEAVKTIADTALTIDFIPDEVWCATGSGTLTRGLQRAWPRASHHAVQVGHELNKIEYGIATIHKVPWKFEDKYTGILPPFSSDLHYDSKAWSVCLTQSNRSKSVLFWNVLGA